MRYVYYSVGQTTSNMSNGGNVSISGGIATFTVAQTTENIGVGDRLTYETGTSHIAYLASKIDTTHWRVVTALGVDAGDHASTDVITIAHEYTSLAAAEAGMTDVNHTNNVNITAAGADVTICLPCYCDYSPDSAVVTFNGTTTDTTHKILVYTPFNTFTECNLSQRHNGAFTTGKYYLSGYSNNGVNDISVLSIKNSDVYVEGIQVEETSNWTYARPLYVGGAAYTGIYVGSSIFKSIVTASYSSRAFRIDLGVTACLYNNVFYGATLAANIQTAGTLLYLYNCTFYMPASAYGVDASNGTTVAKNNIVQGPSTGGYIGSYFHANSTNNLSNKADAPGANAINNATVTFVDAANGDLHLAPADTSGAKGGGVNLTTDADGGIIMNSDIDSIKRPTTWDRGADQFLTGNTCWGHSTGVTETNVLSLAGYWIGTGTIESGGDTERIVLASGQVMESNIIYMGAKPVTITLNKYRSGDTVTIKYKDGSTMAACLAASWVTYSGEFTSSGYVQIRLEST